MLGRFALYGFLKNQRYFEPFFLLYLISLQLSFAEIGLLVAARELMLNCFEIPSGAAADLYGRRKCMGISFLAYIAAFIVFGVADAFYMCLIAMVPLALGDAFRTGTHKAIIFSWLRDQGREDERQQVYGYTRSWSKIGSAISLPIAVILILMFQDYRVLFWVSIVPYVFGFINVIMYPASVEAERPHDVSLFGVLKQSVRVLKHCIVFKPLRQLLNEAMAFEGVFKASKDYLQPILLALAVSLPAFLGTDEAQRTAILIGCFYTVLHVLSAVASRQSHKITTWCGGERSAARALWWVNLLLYSIIGVCLYLGLHLCAALVFVGVYTIQNFWRPLLISRFDQVSKQDDGATVLSVESQARSFTCMLLAPLLGWAVDMVSAHEWGDPYWPVAAFGVAASLWILLWFRK